MKRRIARFITFCIAAVMLLAPSVSKVYAGPAAGDTYLLEYDKDENTHVVLNPDKATVKPSLSLTKLQVPVNQVKWTYTIELTVSGAEKKYAPTGIHVRSLRKRIMRNMALLPSSSAQNSSPITSTKTALLTACSYRPHAVTAITEKTAFYGSSRSSSQVTPR